MKVIPCPVSPETLDDLYTHRKLTDQEIVDHLCEQGHEATLQRVRSWRERFGIMTLPRWARHDLPPIEGQLKSLLVGSMLGDGRLVRRTNATHYEESHSGAQLPYLEWKAAVWGSAWVRTVQEVPDRRGYTQHRLWTVAHPMLNPWRDTFYAERGRGWKRLVPEIVDSVDGVALAVWYLDDGFVGWWPNITFGASSGSREVASSVFEKFGLWPRWVQRTATTYEVHMEREDTAERFLDIIRPHVPACMAYKMEGFGFQGPQYEIRQRMDRETLGAWSAEGVPIREMARMFGVGASTVSRWLKKYEINHPRKVGRPCGKNSV